MSYIITMVSILVLIAAGLVVLTYNGVFTDKDKDGIPDPIEGKLPLKIFLAVPSLSKYPGVGVLTAET